MDRFIAHRVIKEASVYVQPEEVVLYSDVKRLEDEIAELEEKRSTWQELAEMRGDKIDELEAEVDALQFSLDEVGTRNLKADAIRDNIDALLLMNRVEMEVFANNLEQER